MRTTQQSLHSKAGMFTRVRRYASWNHLHKSGHSQVHFRSWLVLTCEDSIPVKGHRMAGSARQRLPGSLVLRGHPVDDHLLLQVGKADLRACRGLSGAGDT